LATPFVVHRLNVLRDELKREEFEVASAHRALLTAMDRIVLHADGGFIELHWRDSDAMSIVPFKSKHVFNDEKAAAPSSSVGRSSPF
jgi:hypothetical protein